jgi:hypothetical protein
VGLGTYKLARQEAAREEAVRQEAARQEAARQEAARQAAAAQGKAEQEAARRKAEQERLAQEPKWLVRLGNYADLNNANNIISNAKRKGFMNIRLFKKKIEQKKLFVPALVIDSQSDVDDAVANAKQIIPNPFKVRIVEWCPNAIEDLHAKRDPIICKE